MFQEIIYNKSNISFLYSEREYDGGEKMKKIKILGMCLCTMAVMVTILLLVTNNANAEEDLNYLESGYSKYAVLVAPLWNDSKSTQTEILNTYNYLNSSDEWNSSNMVLLTENSSLANDDATYLNIKKALDDIKAVCSGDELVFFYLCDTGRENYLEPEFLPGDYYYFMSHSDINPNEPHPWRDDNFASELELINCSEMALALSFSYSGGFGETCYNNNTPLIDSLFVCCSHTKDEATENNTYSIYEGLIEGDANNGGYGTTSFEEAHNNNEPSEGQTPVEFDNNEDEIFPLDQELMERIKRWIKEHLP